MERCSQQPIFQLENQKSPGIDGIPSEFYEEFVKYIEQDLLQLYNNILGNEKETTKNMKQAIITLKPQKRGFTEITILETNFTLMY